MSWELVIQMVMQIVMAMLEKKKAGGISDEGLKQAFLRRTSRWAAVASDPATNPIDRALAGELVETFTCLAAADDAGREQILAQCQAGYAAFAATKGGAA